MKGELYPVRHKIRVSCCSRNTIDNVGNPNWHRLFATLLTRFWWERMSFDCKVYCSNCVVCNRAKPSRQGSSSLSSLGVPNYLWEIARMDFVTNLPKSSKFNFSAILILVCYLTKIAPFVPCHKEITTKESVDLFIDSCSKFSWCSQSHYI